MTEPVFRNDRDWRTIDGRVCHVKVFTPMATVENGDVRAPDKVTPYATIEFDCEALYQDATGYITHKLDFRHLWNAFIERGVGDDEEVIVICVKSQLKRSARLVSKFMPSLCVWVCPRGAFELMI